jgi:PIN domain nuclease of toxin-antitoxin system
MRLLLDTHTFIRSTSDPSKLSTQAQALLVDLEHTLYLSIVSVWEIQINPLLSVSGN